MTERNHGISLDIVIPFYNEEDLLGVLFETLANVFSPANLGENGIRKVRYVLVDDGSVDQTASEMSKRIEAGVPAVLLRLTRNFGHQSAISAGLAYADADVVAVIDSDLQDPPEMIFPMLRKWREGYEVVYGHRIRRKENPLKRLAYWMFYRTLAYLSEIRIPLDCGDFCLMDRRVVVAINSLPENQRFIRGLRAWVGFRQTGIPYERPKRIMGKSKYTLSKLYRLATDGIASTSIRPLRITQFFSFIFFSLSGILSVLIIAQLLFVIPRLASFEFLVVAILVSGGNFTILLCIYILGAYIGRGYLEAKGRPSYLVFEIIGDKNLKNVSEPQKSLD